MSEGPHFGGNGRELAFRGNGSGESFHVTVRDAVAPLFRQRRVALMIFCGVFLGAVLSAFLMPRTYEAEMEILLNRDRVDAAVTPNLDAEPATTQVAPVTEEDLNSEVELLKSRDLLASVVTACGLDVEGSSSRWRRTLEGWSDIVRGGKPSPETRLAGAVTALQNKLIVDPLKKTTLIRVTYASRDPEQAARVLQTLGKLYEEKHAAVHRPTGTFSFFDLEAEHYQNELAAYEARLTGFSTEKGLVDAAIQKQFLLQEISQAQSQLDQDRAAAYAAQQRSLDLKLQEAALPERQTTLIRRADNGELLAQLRSTLLSLELKHTEMLTKYAPQYPLVQELESQIASAKQAIAEAEQSPIEETTTDRTPTQDWMATELAKAEADRATLKAKIAATTGTVHRYAKTAEELTEEAATQGDLTRDVKEAENNYLLYLRKREEARISDALDRERIVNVSIAEAATVPALATLHLGWLLIAGFFAAGTLSVGAAYTLDRIDPSFRTPDELGRYLDVKVLASIPSKTGGE